MGAPPATTSRMPRMQERTQESLLRALGRFPGVRGLGQFVDLAGSLHVDSLARVAAQARGRMLDVGCGEKIYANIFRPFVTEHLGIEYDASFAETFASRRVAAGGGRGPDLYYDGKRLPFEDATFDTVL